MFNWFFKKPSPERQVQYDDSPGIDSARLDAYLRGLQLEDAIRLQAYFLWLEDGCVHGKHVQHWLQAEKMIYAKL